MIKRTIISAFFFLMIHLLSSHAQPVTTNSALTWRKAGTLPALPGETLSFGYAGPVAGTHAGKILVAGGANFPEGMPWEGGRKKYYDVVFIFEKRGSRLQPLKLTAALPDRIAYAAVCSTPQGIFFGGGENENGIRKQACLLRWDEKNHTALVLRLPDLPVALTNASAAFLDGKIYVAGGETTGAVSGDLWSLSPGDTAAGWKKKASLPQAVSHAVFCSAGTGKEPRIYLAGGRKKNANGLSDFYDSFFSYDPQQDQWKKEKPLPYALSAGTGAVLPDGRFYLFGGDKGTVFHEVELLVAAAAATSDEAKKKELVSKKNEWQRTHPGFSREVLCFDPAIGNWQSAGMIPYATPVTTTAFRFNDCILIPSGEIKAGVRTPDILSVKIPRGRR